ncbi:MAG: hypothetical protein FRX49_11057 [Trebouxia sp. A1-2]|nr:MAG: hypothetical protein FRX49_11057 [Trebouxia sp. A1-2]
MSKCKSEKKMIRSILKEGAPREYLVNEDIEGEGKLILVNHTVLHTVLVRMKHRMPYDHSWRRMKAQQAW